MKYLVKLILIVTLTTGFHSFADENPGHITVTGKSEKDLNAEFADLQLEIKQVSADISLGHAELKSSIEQLAKQLNKTGMKSEDIVQSLILQGVEYTWNGRVREESGYYSKCVMEIKVREISKLTEVFNVLSKFNNLTIMGTTYGRTDEFEKRNAEYKTALLLAEKKAKFMAETLNANLGKVISIEELSNTGWFGGSAKIASNSYEAARTAGSTEFGKIKVTATVKVKFELK